MSTLPLFSSVETISLDKKLKGLFESWVERREKSKSKERALKALSEDSAEVYREMWGAFAAFCVERNLDLHEVEREDLELFLSTRGAAKTNAEQKKAEKSGSAIATSKHEDLTARYSRRLLTLIDWLTTFQAREEGRDVNVAAKRMLELPEYRYANAADKDPPPDYLGAVHVKLLIAYVTQRANPDANGSPITWKDVRDRTAVAMMLGAGLAPGDVQRLKLDGVVIDGGRKSGVPWKLALPGNGNSPARETPLANWAGEQLAYWLTVRTEQRIAGDLVFPSVREGRQWSDTRCFEGCRRVLNAAGLSDDSGGLFKLRHTFALRQLSKGKGETDVARWLGLQDVSGMVRYRRLVSSPVDVV